MTEDTETGKKCSVWSTVYWWAALLVAVLAIPSIAFVAAAVVPGQEIWQIMVFVGACWVSTFIGMELMKMRK